MKYKLVCSDIDGTLLDWNGNIPEENKKAIKALEEKGVLFAISTGRMHHSAKMVAELIGIQPYVISACGMVVETPLKGNFLLNKTFDSNIVKKFIGLGNSIEIASINYHYNEGMIITSTKNNYEYDVYAALNERAIKKGMREEDLAELIVDPSERLPYTFRNHFNKMALWMKSVEQQRQVFQYVMENIPEVELSSGIPENIEVTPKGVTKWTGVEAIMKYHGIKAEEVFCIGDSPNDAEMIKCAGLGIAMGNASDEVKDIADFVTDTNENAGFAKAIFKYVL